MKKKYFVGNFDDKAIEVIVNGKSVYLYKSGREKKPFSFNPSVELGESELMLGNGNLINSITITNNGVIVCEK